MNILVYDVAAVNGGALTILKQFYNECVSYSDKSVKWYFVVSIDELKDTDNVKVIVKKNVKKSWVNRWMYDHFGIQKLMKEYDIDKLFSLQNMAIKRTSKKQIVYLHTSLQFSKVNFSLFKGSERNLWIRKNIICRMMRKSLKRADRIIVQTNWMKEATEDWLKCDPSTIKVVPPVVECINNVNSINETDMSSFFYPAGAFVYKNHKLIIEACKLLKENDYKVSFTLDKAENAQSELLYQLIQDAGVNIEYIGYLTKDKMLEMYNNSVLLFPSYLETFGLPLLEGRNSNSVILASDTPFAREILEGYENAYLYDIDDAGKLAEYMQCCIEGKIKKTIGTAKRIDSANKIIDVVVG